MDRHDEKSIFQWRLSRKVKILESRITEMMLQQARNNRNHEMLETRINQLEEQVVSRDKTIEKQQAEIEILKTNKGKFNEKDSEDIKEEQTQQFVKQSNESEGNENISSK